MIAKELTLKTPEELAALERDLRAKIRGQRFALHVGQGKAVRDIRHCKKDLARVLDAMNKKNV